MHLASIAEIFTANYMEGQTNNYGEPIDYGLISYFIESSGVLRDYCERNKDTYNIATCDVRNTTGCAWKSTCRVFEKCVDDLRKPDGFRYDFAIVAKDVVTRIHACFSDVTKVAM